MKNTLAVFSLLLAFVGVIALLFFALWTVGVTPASKDEREFIDALKHSSFITDSRIKAVIAITDQSPYISRHEFIMAEAAFNARQLAYSNGK